MGTVTLPRRLCGRKRQGRSSPESCEHAPARVGPGDTLAPRASDGGDSPEPSQHAGVRGSALCKYTAITAPEAFGPRLLPREKLLAGRGDFGGWGQWEDEGAQRYPPGSPRSAVPVVYVLIQMTVSDLKDLIYFLSFIELIFRVLFCSSVSREIKITKPAIKPDTVVFIFLMCSNIQ